MKYSAVENFGDNLNDYILQQWLGEPVIHVDGSCTSPYLLFIGSLLHQATENAVVWGSGVIGPSFLPRACPAHIACLRGPLSAGRLAAAGHLEKAQPLVFGDPALLLKQLPVAQGPQDKDYDLGIIPHYADHLLFNRHTATGLKRWLSYWYPEKYLFSDAPKTELVYGKRKIRIIDVHDDCESVIKAMKACRAIASSSLHGLIVADVLGIPNTWIRFGDNLTGGSFKFVDYMMSTGRYDVEPLAIQGRIRNRQINLMLQRMDDWHFSFDFEGYASAFNAFMQERKPSIQ
jgi:pyruvyltransferase